MTQILLLDTATRSATLALGKPGDCRIVRSDPAERNSRDLMALVRTLFEDSGGLANAKLDAVGFNRGPGSYTGSRLAASVIQGIAYVKQCPVIELNTLELIYLSGIQALAKSAAAPESYTEALVAVESKVGEYFWARFRFGQDTDAPQITVGNEDALVKALDRSGTLAIMNSSMQAHPRLNSLETVNWVEPRVELAFELAAHRLTQGKVVDALQVEPLYGQDNIGWRTLAEQRAQR
jgi:tRNA threonylcarbamoyladenosine biosynthesis protein TsaB